MRGRGRERDRGGDLGLQEWPVQGIEDRGDAQRGQGPEDLASLGRVYPPHLLAEVKRLSLWAPL